MPRPLPTPPSYSCAGSSWCAGQADDPPSRLEGSPAGVSSLPRALEAQQPNAASVSVSGSATAHAGMQSPQRPSVPAVRTNAARLWQSAVEADGGLKGMARAPVSGRIQRSLSTIIEVRQLGEALLSFRAAIH